MLPQYFYQELYWRRHERLDDLPDFDVRILPLDDPSFNKYKCQGNYIFGLGITLRGAVEEGVIKDPEMIRHIENFIYHDFAFHAGYRTTREEIDMINAILDEALENIRKQYPDRLGEEKKLTE